MLLFSAMLDINERLTKDKFINLVIEWNQNSPYPENVIPGITWNGEHNIRFGNEDLWMAVEEYRNRNIIAVRYEKKEKDGAVWDTDFVMNFTEKRMAVRLDRSYTEDALNADPRFSTPHFITLLIENGYLKDDCGLKVKKDAHLITEDNVSLLADVINGKSRYRLPVVYVSRTRENTDPFSLSYLGSRLKGAAHIMAESDRSADPLIRRECHGGNEYLGAVGIYYPTRAMEHRRYLFRDTEGYDNVLLNKVVRDVILFSNSQRIDPLYTWQGVNNALLKDRLSSQREERARAEEAQKKAEEAEALLRSSLDEKERNIREKAFSEAKAEAFDILQNFDNENLKLQKQIEDLTKANEALQAENQGLKTKLDSMSALPLLTMGDEPDLYPGEIKDLILMTLSETVRNLQDGRRKDVFKDIIANNDYQKLSLKKKEDIKRVLKTYSGMDAKTRSVLEHAGFNISTEGGHPKLVYYGDERYMTTLSSTPSEGRGGKNNASELCNTIF